MSELQAKLQALIDEYGANEARDAFEDCSPFREETIARWQQEKEERERKYEAERTYLSSREEVLKLADWQLFFCPLVEYFTINGISYTFDDGTHPYYQEPIEQYEDCINWFKAHGWIEHPDPTFPQGDYWFAMIEPNARAIWEAEHSRWRKWFHNATA